MTDDMRFIDIPGAKGAHIGISEDDAKQMARTLGPERAERARDDCPAMRLDIKSFSVSERAVTKSEFATFWYSADSLELSPSDEDKSYWEETFNIPGYHLDAPIVGLTHTEAEVYAMSQGARLPFQHELEYLLRGDSESGLNHQQYSEMPSFFPELVTALKPADELDPCGPFQVKGLAGVIRSLAVLDSRQANRRVGMPEKGRVPTAIDVVKPTSGADLVLHCGGYLFFPAWLFYFEEDMRVQPLSAPGLWLVR